MKIQFNLLENHLISEVIQPPPINIKTVSYPSKICLNFACGSSQHDFWRANLAVYIFGRRNFWSTFFLNTYSLLYKVFWRNQKNKLNANLRNVFFALLLVSLCYKNLTKTCLFATKDF
jgi:hypothetical protein